MMAPGRGTGEALLELRCPAALEQLGGLMQQVDEALARGGATADEAHDLRLAVEEACVNVMRHGWPGTARHGELSLEIRPARLGASPALRVELRDDGRAFDPLAAAAPDLGMGAEDRPIGGLGIHMIRTLTDAQQYSREGDHGNRLVLFKRLAGAAAP